MGSHGGGGRFLVVFSSTFVPFGTPLTLIFCLRSVELIYIRVVISSSVTLFDCFLFSEDPELISGVVMSTSGVR